MNDDQIIARGGSERDVEEYARMNGASMDEPTREPEKKQIYVLICEDEDTRRKLMKYMFDVNKITFIQSFEEDKRPDIVAALDAIL